MALNPEHPGGSEVAAVEIERKFLIDSTNVPEGLHLFQREWISQGYLVIGEDGSEARVRDRGSVFTMTVKSKGDLTRGEYETEISAEQFDALWPATDGKRIEKMRYGIPAGEAMIELDIYEGDLEGLIVAEVEFDSEASAHSFEEPEWFGPDVTMLKGFKNQSLAVRGAPEL